MANCDNLSIRDCDNPIDGRSALTSRAMPDASVKTGLETLGKIGSPGETVRPRRGLTSQWGRSLTPFAARRDDTARS
jgi:hypothetical protein